MQNSIVAPRKTPQRAKMGQIHGLLLRCCHRAGASHTVPRAWGFFSPPTCSQQGSNGRSPGCGKSQLCGFQGGLQLFISSAGFMLELPADLCLSLTVLRTPLSFPITCCLQLHPQQVRSFGMSEPAAHTRVCAQCSTAESGTEGDAPSWMKLSCPSSVSGNAIR